jgi:hypothetical protein
MKEAAGMADFISRDTILEKLNKKFCAYCPLPDCDANCKLHYLLDAVKEEPAAYVVEVVRCKDCIHLGFKDFNGICNGPMCCVVKPWDYCSHGAKVGG